MKKDKNWFLLITFLAATGLGAAYLVWVLMVTRTPVNFTDPPLIKPIVPIAEGHQVMPEKVKGIYITASTVGSARRFGELIDLVGRTELNAVVIDVKADSGELAFAPLDPALANFAGRAQMPRLEDMTADLHRRGIYIIARIFVFEDPWYAERVGSPLRTASGDFWTDRKGIKWVDQADKEVWNYNAAIAREVWRRGFDEVQFDYIRFPTDGDTKKIVYPVWDGQTPRRTVITDFFRFLHDELESEGIPVSVDLFGYAVRYDENDLGIGQNMKDALPFVTAISPMVYPSHYYAGSYGLARPAEQPALIVAKSMAIAQDLIASSTPDHATVRPWLQDFDIGAEYDAKKVRAQIDAAEAGRASGWLLWNARNVYTEGALRKE